MELVLRDRVGFGCASPWAPGPDSATEAVRVGLCHPDYLLLIDEVRSLAGNRPLHQAVLFSDRAIIGSPRVDDLVDEFSGRWHRDIGQWVVVGVMEDPFGSFPDHGQFDLLRACLMSFFSGVSCGR